LAILLTATFETEFEFEQSEGNLQIVLQLD